MSQRPFLPPPSFAPAVSFNLSQLACPGGESDSLAKSALVGQIGPVKSIRFYPVLLLSLLCALNSARGGDAVNPFIGSWGLTIPGGHAGWLGVQLHGNRIDAQMLWGWGSVFKLDGARLDGETLVLTRVHHVDRKKSNGTASKVKLIETITATLDGDSLKLVTATPTGNGGGEDRAEFTGKRLPPMPPAPDLSKVKFGEPVHLFDGNGLDGWRLVEPDAVNGWSVHEGTLVNNVVQEEGKPEKNFGNLRTISEFEDFMLHAETRVPKEGNSGIYLRGMYEVQVFDSYLMPLDSHNMGAIYSRIKPTVNAELPAGEWQTLDITFVKRHVTVVLNGTKIIDNQPVLGPTGGALWSDVERPGPIYLQGDHTGIEYRNIFLRPVVN